MQDSDQCMDGDDHIDYVIALLEDSLDSLKEGSNMRIEGLDSKNPKLVLDNGNKANCCC